MIHKKGGLLLSAWKYKQLMPKLTVEKLKLIDNKQIIGLVGASLSHISSVLQNTPYKLEILEASRKELNSLSLEAALQKNFTRTCEELLTLSSGGIHSLISGLLLKFEANTVKTLLRTVKANLSTEKALNYIVPVGNLNEQACRKVLENSETLEDVIDVVSEYDYGEALETAFDVYLKTKDFHVLEVALDRYVYFNLWKNAGNLWGLDKKIAKNIFGLEIDLVNVKTVFRCKKMNLNLAEIKQYLIDVSSVFDKIALNKAITAKDTQSTIDSLFKSGKDALARDHQYIFDELQKSTITSLSNLENVLDRGLLDANLRMIKRHTAFFNVGLLLAFLTLKRFEIKNLRAIIRGSEAGIVPERVKEMLIFKRVN